MHLTECTVCDGVIPFQTEGQIFEQSNRRPVYLPLQRLSLVRLHPSLRGTSSSLNLNLRIGSLSYSRLDEVCVTALRQGERRAQEQEGADHKRMVRLLVHLFTKVRVNEGARGKRDFTSAWRATQTRHHLTAIPAIEI